MGYNGVVKLLLGHKDIYVNARDYKKRTALILAYDNRRHGVVKLLLDYMEWKRQNNLKKVTPHPI